MAPLHCKLTCHLPQPAVTDDPPPPRHPLPHRAQQSCCGSSYIPTDPAAPALLEPWEWGEWLHMCKTGGEIEAALSERGRQQHASGPAVGTLAATVTSFARSLLLSPLPRSAVLT